MLSRFFNHPQFMLENSAYTSVFWAIFLSYNCYYEKFSDGSVKNIQDEIPFDLPECWSWARGKNCFQEMKTRKPNGEEFVYIDIDAIDNKKNTITNAKVLKVKDAPSRACRYVECGSVLFSLVRPYLKNIAFVEEKYASSIASSGFFVCTSTGVLYPRYSFYLMISPYVVNGINQFMKGDNSPSVSKSDIENWLYPIPPYNEQKQIVDCLNKTLAIIQNIHDTENELQGEITSIKSKILELAIQGKLVPQDENDEPASVLLERIRAERKAKLGKKYVESYIFKGDDNCYYENNDGKVAIVNEFLPFDLPDGWAYVRLENVLNYEQPTEYIVESTDYRSEYKTPVLTAGKSFIIGYTNETVGIKSELPVIIFDDFTTDSKFVNFPFKVKSSAMKILTADKLSIDTKYAYYVMQTVECDHETHKRYWISEYGRTIIGLPPLNEQLKIVNQIEYLFSLLDNGKEP